MMCGIFDDTPETKPAGAYAGVLTELVGGLIIIGIMVVTWKAGAPWGWVVFEAVLALLCMV